MRVSRRAGPDRAGEASGAGGTAGGCAETVVPGRPTGRALGVLAGFREPVVLILLAIAFFTAISGKPVDGVLMVIVAAGLGWDAGRRARRGQPDPAQPAAAAPGPAPTGRSRWLGRRQRVLATALLAGGLAYAGVVGSFIRYSWPATAGIILLGTVVVVIGWQRPVRGRATGGRLPITGTLAWVVVLVFGCLWELAALLLQPSITTDSYAHPTISTLTDPVLASSPGRALMLAAWLAFGWYLVER